MKNPGLKPFDYIITVLSILFIVFLSIRIYSGNSNEAVLKVDADGTQYIYPLDQDAELEFDGPIGHTHVIIRDGEAFISESPCDNNLCVLMGKISNSGQWAACLPNRIFLSIEGGSDNEEIDVLSY